MDYEIILDALKNGNVPPKGTLELSMGREKEIKEFERLLDKIDTDGRALVKFVKGHFGTGKSFFLKMVEEMAFEKNFVVSWITISNDIPFNKIDIVYKNIAKNLRCKTGTSLDHIIDRWLTDLKMMAIEETSSPEKQQEMINNNIHIDLAETREHSNPFAIAIESYNTLMDEGNLKTASYALSWLRGDSNIPFVEKRKFGVKGDITKENAISFLEALSIYLKSIGYAGLVVLIDEAEFIRNLHTKKLRDIGYNYIRDIYDNCNLGKFQNTLFLFAGTPELFDDDKKGIPSYAALGDRIYNILNTNLPDMRKPIFELKGFTENEIKEISGKIIIMHEKTYNWDASDKINPVLNDIVAISVENAGLTGKEITPRVFIRSFISVLDIVQQNQESFKEPSEILKLFDVNSIGQDNNFDDEIDEFDDDW